MISYIRAIYPLLGLMVLGGGCSTAQQGDKHEEKGPTILTARSEPGTIELNRDLQPIQAPKVIVDVKDFRSQVTDVMLHFENVPITVPMENVGGSTWEAKLDAHQLEMMAVSGETIKYGAQVIAKNADGKTATSEKPVEIAVKAPRLAQPSNI